MTPWDLLAQSGLAAAFVIAAWLVRQWFAKQRLNLESTSTVANADALSAAAVAEWAIVAAALRDELEQERQSRIAESAQLRQRVRLLEAEVVRLGGDPTRINGGSDL